MKFKVKELMERKERTWTARANMDNLKPLDSDKTLQTLLIDCDDAECVSIQLEEYEELLEDLISAAEVSF